MNRVPLSFKSIDILTGKSVEIFLFSFPKQEAPNVIIQENGAHEFFYIPGLPLEFSLKIRNYKVTCFQSVE
jgi:hypothetical protein